MQTFGYGIAYNCVLITAQKWLPHRVGLAGGLIVSGFGCGAFMISPIQTKYINPWNYSPNEDGFFTQPELLERVPEVFLVLASVFGVLQMIGLLFIGERKEAVIPYESDHNLQHGREQLSLSEILKSSTFVMLFMTLLFNGVWVQSISGLYKAFGQQFVSDDFFFATISSFAAIFNCASRVLWGTIADRTSYQTSMVIACTIGCVFMWTLGLVKLLSSPALLFIWVCGMFCCVGATYSLLPYAAHKCFGAEQFGLVYGSIQIALTFSGIVNALLSQFVLPRVGYVIHFLIIGVLLFVSLIISALINFSKHGSPRTISYERLE
uniref:MFS domain-containing protein n=1 Tax=Steinernema glaseri TaxID=37863 RepID=A0A1I8ADF3_9BILA